jgi:two-component system, sensor histidine kinase
MGKLTILNVDDYEPARYARTKLLRGWGFDVREASTGAEALRLATLEPPALVILDVHLPDMNGFEVCRRLKRDHDGSAMPVLHVSATFTSGEHQALGLSGGADGYLVEPVEPAVLRVTIDTLLRAQHAEQARAAAEAANQAKDDFLAVLGHELRTPLMPISLTMRALERTHPTEPDIIRAREIVERQVRHLTRLVDDLLDVARLSRRMLRLHVEPVDLGAVVRDAADAMRQHVETRRHRLTLRIPDAPVWVHGDAVRLGQIASNLIGNAAKFTPPEGHITVTLERAARDAVLRVRDNGIGITRESLPLIFRPFTQGARTADAAERGLGIGLALVSGLVEAHAGTVTVASEGPGHGSEFTVRLPLGPPAAAVTRAPESRAVATRARILVVEDHADSRTVLAETLRVEGHDVVAVGGGAEALDAALASPPDVAVIDIGLADMDGYDVARRLRTQLGAAVLLIAVTGYAAPDDVEHARAAGFDAHVTKPVAGDELLRMLRSRTRR